MSDLIVPHQSSWRYEIVPICTPYLHAQCTSERLFICIFGKVHVHTILVGCSVLRGRIDQWS